MTTFTVQSRPRLRLLSLGGTVGPPVVANNPLTLTWQVDDADDADPTVHATLQYQWGAGRDDWHSIATINGQSFIPVPTIERGKGLISYGLWLCALDADGNLSSVQFFEIAVRSLPSYTSLITTGVGALVSVIALLGVGLVTLAHTSGLPFPLLLHQGAPRWLPTGLGYRRYRTQWEARLSALQTPVSTTRLEEALTSLTRQQLLQRQGAGYRVTEPALLTALQAHEGATSRQHLAARVRAEHPLVAAANHFFPAAGFTITPLADPLAFLCQPNSPVWEPWFKTPVYIRLIPDHPLDQEAIAELNRAAQSVPERANVLFALINQTPTDSGWIAIGALRADGIQVIPIDDAFMQQARSQQRERQELQAHLRRFLGRQRDLYNVRDPVADRLNFFGREATTQALLEILTAGRPLALFGLRKMGKSSLLQVLGDRALPRGPRRSPGRR